MKKETLSKLRKIIREEISRFSISEAVKEEKLGNWKKNVLYYKEMMKKEPEYATMWTKEIKKAKKVPGDIYSVDAGSPGTGRCVYKITRVEANGDFYGIETSNTVRTLDIDDAI